MTNVKGLLSAALACCLLVLASPCSSQDQDLGTLLAATDIFKGLDAGELSQVAELAMVRFGGEGEELITLGGETHALYTLQSGLAVIVDASGRTIYEFGPGIVVGEFEFVSGKPGCATVTITQDAEVVEIDGVALRGLMDADTALGYKIMGNMAYKLSTY